MPKAIRTTRLLILHTQPSPTSDVHNRIPKGRIVNILQFEDGWMFVQDQEEPTTLGYVEVATMKFDRGRPNNLPPTPTEATPEPEPTPTPEPTPEPTTTSVESSEDLSISPDPDQRIDNAQSSNEKVVARVWNKFGGLLEDLSNEYGIDVAASVAVVAVESGGRGFSTDGKMIIRFENHLFHRIWGKNNEAKYNEHFQFNQDQQWKNHMFRGAPSMDFQAFHGSQANEWVVFEFARTLDGKSVV